MADVQNRLTVSGSANMSDLVRGVRDYRGEVGSLSESQKEATTGSANWAEKITAVASAIDIGTRLLGLLNRATLENARLSQEQDEALAGLAFSLSRVNIEYDEVNGRLSEFFAGLQAVTRFGDSDAQQAMATIANSTAALGPSIDDLERWTALAADVAQATGRDLASSAQVVSQAAAGNVTVLNRLIPMYRDQLREVSLLSDANERGARAVDLLSEAFEGAARDSLPRYSLQLARIQNGAGDVREALGAVVTRSDGVSAALGAIATTADTVAAAFDPASESAQSFQTAVGRMAVFGATSMLQFAQTVIGSFEFIAGAAEELGGERNRRRDQTTGRQQAAQQALSLTREATSGGSMADAVADARRIRRIAEAAREAGVETNVDTLRDRSGAGQAPVGAVFDELERLEEVLTTREQDLGMAVGRINEEFQSSFAMQLTSLREQLADIQNGLLRGEFTTDDPNLDGGGAGGGGGGGGDGDGDGTGTGAINKQAGAIEKVNEAQREKLMLFEEERFLLELNFNLAALYEQAELERANAVAEKRLEGIRRVRAEEAELNAQREQDAARQREQIASDLTALTTGIIPVTGEVGDQLRAAFEEGEAGAEAGAAAAGQLGAGLASVGTEALVAGESFGKSAVESLKGIAKMARGIGAMYIATGIPLLIPGPLFNPAAGVAYLKYGGLLLAGGLVGGLAANAAGGGGGGGGGTAGSAAPSTSSQLPGGADRAPSADQRPIVIQQFPDATFVSDDPQTTEGLMRRIEERGRRGGALAPVL